MSEIQLKTKDDVIHILSEGTCIREETISKLNKVIELLHEINLDQANAIDNLAYFTESEDCPKDVRLTLKAIRQTLSVQISAVSKIQP